MRFAFMVLATLAMAAGGGFFWWWNQPIAPCAPPPRPIATAAPVAPVLSVSAGQTEPGPPGCWDGETCTLVACRARFTRFAKEDTVAALERHKLEAHAEDGEGKALEVVKAGELPAAITKTLDDGFAGREGERAWRSTGEKPVFRVRFARDVAECLDGAGPKGQHLKVRAAVHHEYLAVLDADGKLVESRTLE